jgi:hypothetical protein
MRFERLLVHRCTIVYSTDVVVGKDPYNRDIYGDEPNSNVPCRVDQIKRSVSADTNGVDNIVDNILFLSPTTQVNESMKIMDIKAKNGEVVLEGVFTVNRIDPIQGKRKLHHYEVTLKKEGEQDEQRSEFPVKDR